MVRKQQTEKPIPVPAVKGEVVAPFNCWRCGKKLADAAGPGSVHRCLRCGARSRVPVAD